MGFTMKCLDRGFVVWFTGFPGSGKSTVASGVARVLKSWGYRVEFLDGDWVRRTISVGAGFTREERRRHLLRVAWVARLLARNGVIVLCSFVSPYRDVRAEVRSIVEEEGIPFVEVFVKCSLEECIRRDPKGLYKKALAGEIKNFTGISDPYEEPENPEVVVDTEHYSAEENVSRVITYLKERGLVEEAGSNNDDGGGDSEGSPIKRIIGYSRELHLRSILKALSYRLYQSFLISPLIVWVLTGNWVLGLKFGVVEFIVKIPAYYLFERVWSHVSYGYRK